MKDVDAELVRATPLMERGRMRDGPGFFNLLAQDLLTLLYKSLKLLYQGGVNSSRE